MKRTKIDTGFTEPDMTPMIDIVFQLLTFFMIVSNFESTKADERVKLPKDVLAKPPESRPEEELVLNYGFERNAKGEITNPTPVLFYNAEDIPLDRFKPMLEQERRLFLAKDGDKALDKVTVTLRADSEVPTGLVQGLIKVCQEVGFSRFALKATQEDY